MIVTMINPDHLMPPALMLSQPYGVWGRFTASASAHATAVYYEHLSSSSASPAQLMHQWNHGFRP